MTSHHVTSHVPLYCQIEKEKEKGIQKKRNIKSRKIDKRKKKKVSPHTHHNIVVLTCNKFRLDTTSHIEAKVALFM